MVATEYAAEAAWVQSLADALAPSSAVRGIIAQPPPGFGTSNVSVADMATALDDLLTTAPSMRGVRPGVNWLDLTQLPYLIAHTQLLADRGLVMDLNAPMGSNASVAVLQLVAAVPNCMFILDHIGNAPVLGTPAQATAWQQALTALAQYPNVFCKVSGVMQGFKASKALPPVSAVQPWVTFAIQAFGFQRCLFAGNWFFVNWLQPPLLDVFSTWAQYLMAILGSMNATAVDMENIFYRTAIVAYGVTPV